MFILATKNSAIVTFIAWIQWIIFEIRYRKTPYTGMVTLMRNTTPPQRTLLIFQYLFEDKELKAGTFFEQDVNMRESFQWRKIFKFEIQHLIKP